MFAMLMGLKNITPQELHARMQREPMTVIDMNGQQSFQTARVPGAVNLPLDYAPDALPADKAASLVFYCSNPLCRKAPSAARRAKQLGYTQVLVLSAGIAGWLNAQLPVMRGQ